MKSNRIVCFTGHRHIDYYDREDLMISLEIEIERRIQKGAEIFRAGGALGFDTMAALAVLKLKTKYPHIRLELILPCPSQTQNWASADVKRYKEILRRADSYLYVSDTYFNGLLQLRNNRLVEGADVCIAYLKHSQGGGSAYTSALAIRSGLEYVNLLERVGWESV